MFQRLRREIDIFLYKLEGRFRTFLLVFLFGSLYFVMLYKRQDPGMTPLMAIRFIDQVRDGRPLVLRSTWVPIEKISDASITAVMAGEDQKFLDHYGFDFDALRTALEINLKNKSISIGGSTISQQTAKNVFLRPGRSILRKGLEAYFTILIELVWSKERILETYLNIVEFGDGIYGIEQASQYYFDTSADTLTRQQAALLAAILPNPRYYQHHLRSYRVARRKSAISSGINRLKREEEQKEFIQQIKQ